MLFGCPPSVPSLGVRTAFQRRWGEELGAHGAQGVVHIGGGDGDELPRISGQLEHVCVDVTGQLHLLDAIQVEALLDQRAAACNTPMTMVGSAAAASPLLERVPHPEALQRITARQQLNPSTLPETKWYRERMPAGGEVYGRQAWSIYYRCPQGRRRVMTAVQAIRLRPGHHAGLPYRSGRLGP